MPNYPTLTLLAELYNDPGPYKVADLGVDDVKHHLATIKAPDKRQAWIKSLPAIANFKIFSVEHPEDATMVMYLIDPSKVTQTAKDMVVGVATFDRGMRDKTLYVGAVALHDNVRGQGLMLQLYVYLIKRQGYTLLSGESQTADALAMWRRLAKTPGVFVYGWDESEDKPFHVFDREDDYGFDGKDTTTHHYWLDYTKIDDEEESEIALHARDEYRLVATKA